MKFIPPPAATDVLNLRLLARNQNLNSFPLLAGSYRDILRSYCTYRNALGNAKAAALAIPDQLKPLLRNHYKHPPMSLDQYLLDLRKRTSPDVCSMCGSAKSGELDHVLPINNFAEFSVFTLNLVPACDCNRKRSTNFVGPGNGERVLHPYFDQVLTQRLVRALIEPSAQNGYEGPGISIFVMPQPGSANYEAVNFHVTKVLKRTDVLEHFVKTWPKFWSRPEDYFGQPTTLPEFRQAVRDALSRKDRHFGTPNNWDSMLFAGLEANLDASAALWQRMTHIRNQTAVPQTNQFNQP